MTGKPAKHLECSIAVGTAGDYAILLICLVAGENKKLMRLPRSLSLSFIVTVRRI
jgi:hypothetical protein